MSDSTPRAMPTLVDLIAIVMDAGDTGHAAFHRHVQALSASDPAQAAAWLLALVEHQDQAQARPAHPPQFLGTCQRAGRPARVYGLAGVPALALPGPTGAGLTLRVSHDFAGEGRPFSDCRWAHDDASVRVVDDLAVVYVMDNGQCVFDHHPQVLGLALDPPPAARPRPV